MNKCVIVIPAYKPLASLVGLVQSLQMEWVEDIICIDDGSGEEFSNVFNQIETLEKTSVLKHAINMGKGRALKTAFNHILNKLPKADMVITVDADGQHTPEAVRRVYNSFSGEKCMILGKREFTNINSKKDIPFRSRFGNRMTKMVFNFLCNIDISDTQTGLRCIPMTVLPHLLEVSGEKYEYETNCLLCCKDYSIAIKEIEIETIYENDNESSHFNPLRDSIRIYMIIFKYLCSSVLAVIMDYFVFFTLANFISNVFILTYLGRICSSITNFIVNKKVVFRIEGKGISQAIKYYLLVFISGTISAIAISLFKKFISENLLLAKIVVETVLFFFNFYVQKNLIFVKS